MIKELNTVDNLNKEGDEVDSTIYDEEGEEFDDDVEGNGYFNLDGEFEDEEFDDEEFEDEEDDDEEEEEKPQRGKKQRRD